MDIILTCLLIKINCVCRDCECCRYGVLHPAGDRGSSLVTPCGMLVVGGGGGGSGKEGEVKVWSCDSGERFYVFKVLGAKSQILCDCNVCLCWPCL